MRSTCLYEADLMSLDPLWRRCRSGSIQADPPVPEYAVELIEGVVANLTELDRLIARLSESWTMSPDAGGRPQRACASARTKSSTAMTCREG